MPAAALPSPYVTSAVILLDDFSEAYPQWAQAVTLIDEADSLPVSDAWGIGQWVLQDAIYRFMRLDIPDDSSINAELTPILEELDLTILELVEMDLE